MSESELQATECPTKSSKVIKRFSSSRICTQKHVMRHFTGNDTDQGQNSSSKLLIPYREQPQSTRIAAVYPRPAFSATKRTNHAPIRFDQQAQVSQSHISHNNKGNRNTEVHGDGDLELVEPAREPASSRLKPCASLKKSHEPCPFATPC